jgi:hypothetical protein
LVSIDAGGEGSAIQSTAKLLKYLPHVAARDSELMFSLSSILLRLTFGSFRINIEMMRSSNCKLIPKIHRIIFKVLNF